jgi:hypothetical protein
LGAGSLAIYLSAASHVFSRTVYLTGINKNATYRQRVAMPLVGRTKPVMVDRYPASCPGSVGLWVPRLLRRRWAQKLCLGFDTTAVNARIGSWHQDKPLVPNWNPSLQVLRGNLGGRQDGRTGAQDEQVWVVLHGRRKRK